MHRKAFRHCILAIAGCFCLGCVQHAESSPSIVWSGEQDIETTMFDTGFTYMDLDSNGTDDFSIRRYGDDVFVFSLSEGNEFFCTINEDPRYLPAARPESTGVLADDSPEAPYVWSGDNEGYGQIMMAYGQGYWVGADHAYMGVRFLAEEDLLYGWIEMSLDASAPYTMTIHSWAYETQPGVGITFGVVPEPSTWALFLIGVACLACLKEPTPNPSEEGNVFGRNLLS